jgi:DNA polymerase-1
MDYLDAPEQLSRQLVLDALKPILESSEIGKDWANLKYDAHILANISIDLCGIVDDTMVKSYCLNSVHTRHNMDDLSEYYLGHKRFIMLMLQAVAKAIDIQSSGILTKLLRTLAKMLLSHMKLNKVLQERLEKFPKLVSLYKTWSYLL